MHATGPIAIASIQAASTTNTIHRGKSSVKRASPAHGGRWLAHTNHDALMTHHTTVNVVKKSSRFQPLLKKSALALGHIITDISDV